MNEIFEQTENFHENLIRDIHLLAEESYYKWYIDALQSWKKAKETKWSMEIVLNATKC